MKEAFCDDNYQVIVFELMDMNLRTYLTSLTRADEEISLAMLCVSQLLCLRSHTPPPPLRHSVLHPPATPGDPLLSLLWHHAPRPQATQPLLARWDLEDRKLSICEIVRAADSPSLPGGPLPLPLTSSLAAQIVHLHYRAPEILLEAPSYSPAVDLWSIGCILWEMIQKRVLFPGESQISQLHLIFQ
jgi:serine/threonine protein kinase